MCVYVCVRVFACELPANFERLICLDASATGVLYDLLERERIVQEYSSTRVGARVQSHPSDTRHAYSSTPRLTISARVVTLFSTLEYSSTQLLLLVFWLVTHFILPRRKL